MISIIVNAYNKEKDIKDTIESILKQTYSEFELICVDDGSTDNTSYILNQFEEKDNRIKVVHKENGGASSARECGYLNAQGEYIIFGDADDIWSPYLLEYSLRAIEKGFNAVYVKFKDIRSEAIDRFPFRHHHEVTCYETTGLELLSLSRRKANVFGHRGRVALGWAVLFRYSWFTSAIQCAYDVKERFPYRYFNDSYLIPHLLAPNDRVAIIDEICYLHRVMPESLSYGNGLSAHVLEWVYQEKYNMDYVSGLGDSKLFGNWVVSYYLVLLKMWYKVVTFGTKDQKARYLSDIERMYFEDFQVLKSAKLGLKDKMYRLSILLWKYDKRLWLVLCKKATGWE